MKFNKNIITAFVFISGLMFVNIAQNRGALEVVKSVTDRIIKETEFELELVEQSPELGVQILDFNKESSGQEGVFYALSYINCDYDTILLLGISASENISLFLNGMEIFFNKSPYPLIKEIAYGMINFNDTIKVEIKKGVSSLLIKAVQSSGISKIFLRQIIDNPESAGFIKFSSSSELKTGNSDWLIAGPFDYQSNDTPEQSIKPFYSNSDDYITWSMPRKKIIAQLKINQENVFTKDSYADWNYANGETLLSILDLAESVNSPEYFAFVEKWCNYISDNISYFRYQYDSLNALRGSYHRIFRKTMLDDAAAPILPFVQSYLNNKKEKYLAIIREMVDYTMNGQARLPDGTFCRPEPVEMTVWADDLFMSVPLMLRMGKITGDSKYYEDAVNQIKNFTSLLFNQDKGLFKHGWFSKTDQTSVAFWGRANGWVIWALSEALLYLPKDKQYYDILTIYKNHIDGLIKHQDSNGMWHQVLDHPESYEESSCTAMFILGIARGINNKWLDASYSANALSGWNALVKKIEPDGIVHGICRGTGIGNDLDFYFNRPTLANDPRGLGAVITAGIEISKLESKK